ncbi:uncharacterized protein LOC117998601 [Mirounga leonina]|uniref:uncharacterized protein LOC117998601 n=1 Tax=Mirounga leonina TaxID=9715 RepID=UPI00156C066A|nr:uncharacterized protein LOC117998601 [Mirounga leonina]
MGAGRGEAGQRAKLLGPQKDVEADPLLSPCWEESWNTNPISSKTCQEWLGASPEQSATAIHLPGPGAYRTLWDFVSQSGAPGPAAAPGNWIDRQVSVTLARALNPEGDRKQTRTGTGDQKGKDRNRAEMSLLRNLAEDGFVGTESVWKGRVPVGRGVWLLSQGVSPGGLPGCRIPTSPPWAAQAGQLPASDVSVVPSPPLGGHAKGSSPSLPAPLSGCETCLSWGGVHSGPR